MMKWIVNIMQTAVLFVLVKISCVAGDFRSKTIIDAAEKSPHKRAEHSHNT
jgi:hypothetical protein